MLDLTAPGWTMRPCLTDRPEKPHAPIGGVLLELGPSRFARSACVRTHPPARRPGLFGDEHRQEGDPRLLAEHARISRLEPAAVERSRDGTVKFAFRLDDGAAIESVLIPADGRHTLCVSSQAGCAMGCRFCLTAGMGFQRNLTPAEIVNQVMAVQEHMIRGRRRPGDDPAADRQSRVHGHGGTAGQLRQSDRRADHAHGRPGPGLFGAPGHGVNLRPGPADRGLGRDIRVNLAVSLHAADDPTRSSLMPVNRTYGVDEVLAACRTYPLSKKQVIFIEYVLIEGLNDSAADAPESCRRNCRACAAASICSSTTSRRPCPTGARRRASVKAFQDILRSSGFRTLVRNSRGADISAACGQLAAGGRPAEHHDAATAAAAAKSTCAPGACVLINSDTCTGARSSAG